MPDTTASPRRTRLRVGVLAGATLLAVASAQAPVPDSSAAGGAPRAAAHPAHPAHAAHRDGVENRWHAARLSTGAAAARSDQVSRAVSPSPHLSRAQLDTMSPRQVVAATLGDVLRERPHAAHRAARHHKKLKFGLTTFNTLGSQHTAPFGDADQYAPGRIRTQWMTDYLAGLGSSVIGMQEIQPDQVDNLNLTTGGQYSFWPGSALGPGGEPQSMMWLASAWKAKRLDYLVVPFMGATRPQPVVLLKNLKTKRKIWVLNIHNSPKDAQGRQKERDKAVKIERKAVRSLRSQGYPVFILGDFNEHATAYCSMTKKSGLKAANGGRHPRKGSCRPPGNMRVDWIFGSREAKLSDYRMDQGPLVQRITDHAVVTTQVTLKH